MKRYIFLFCFFLVNFSKNASSQKPGAVSNNLTLWLKANTATASNITVSPGLNVSAWKSESGTYTISQTTPSKQPILQNLPTNNANFNFNPNIKFNGTLNTTLFNSSITPNLLGTNGSIFLVCNKYLPAGSGSLLTYMSSSSYRYQLKPSFRLQNGALGTGYKFELTGLPGAIINYTDEAAMIFTMTSTGLNSRGRRNSTDFGPPTGNSGTYNPAVQQGLFLGSNGSAAEFCNMAVAEVIFYNRTLTATEINRVESYLAIKYGITFNEVVTQSSNYVASDGTVIWNKTSNTGFNENIMGIGRDDSSGLMQKQSHSVNSKSLLYIYNGTNNGLFPIMNDSNTHSFSTNKSFVVMGENMGDTLLDQCMMNGRVVRMARTWKIQQTGNSETVTVAFPDSLFPCAKRLLISSNSNFPDNATTIVPMISANGFRYAEFIPTNNSYISFSTDSLLDPIVPPTQSCPGNPVTLTIQNPQSCFSYEWYSNVTGGVALQTGFTFNLTSFTSDTTFYIAVNGPGSCTLSPRVPVNVTLIPVPAPISNDTSICPGSSVQLNVENPITGQSYFWYDAATGGTLLSTGTSYTTPNLNSTTVYYLSTSIAAGCSSIRIPVTVTIYTAPIAAIVNSPITICPNSSATISVQNPQAGYVYTWFTSSTGGSSLGTGISYTTPNLSSSTTYYVETQSAEGCIHTVRTAGVVSIDNAPTAPVVNSPINICPGETALFTIQNPQAGLTYTWFESPGGAVLTTGTSFSTPILNGPTNYTVSATNATGCIGSSAIASVVIWQPLPNPNPIVFDSTANSLSFSWASISGASGYLVSTDGGVSYQTPSSGANGTTHTISGLEPSQSVTLYVVATHSISCKQSTAGVATGTTLPLMTDIFIPSAFTPNNDKTNDVLHVIGRTVKTFRFIIYNRWGQKVFETNDINTGWDGTFKGKEQPTGAYSYFAQAILINGMELTKKGTVTLYR